jgi:hypothetical protein
LKEGSYIFVCFSFLFCLFKKLWKKIWCQEWYYCIQNCFSNHGYVRYTFDKMSTSAWTQYQCRFKEQTVLCVVY